MGISFFLKDMDVSTKSTLFKEVPMKRFEALTESDCAQLQKEVTELLSPLAEKYGICVDSVKAVCSTGGESISVQTRFALPPRPDSVATLKEELDFRAYAEGFGLKPAWLGQEFKRGEFTYKVAGLMVDAPSKCVVLERSDGARFEQEGKMVSRYLG
jgi:hypothetical protein